MEKRNRNNQDGPIGPVIGSIIIVVLLILGGLYFWADKLTRDAKIKAERERIQKEAALQSNDDLKSIEADLKKQDVTKLQTQIQTIK